MENGLDNCLHNRHDLRGHSDSIVVFTNILWFLRLISSRAIHFIHVLLKSSTNNVM